MKIESSSESSHLSTNPTALRVMLKTLRAIEIVESRFNFFTGVSKNDSTKLNVCSAGVANTQHPSHSQYRSALATANF